MFFVRLVTGHLFVCVVLLYREVMEFMSFCLECLECVETKTSGQSWGPILFTFIFKQAVRN